MDKIQRLWREHQAAPFPADFLGQEIEGVDIISVDSYAAGCISTFIESSGRLDTQRLDILQGCHDELARILPVLDGESRAYVERLHRLTVLVLAALKQR